MNKAQFEELQRRFEALGEKPGAHSLRGDWQRQTDEKSQLELWEVKGGPLAVVEEFRVLASRAGRLLPDEAGEISKAPPMERWLAYLASTFPTYFKAYPGGRLVDDDDNVVGWLQLGTLEDVVTLSALAADRLYEVPAGPENTLPLTEAQREAFILVRDEGPLTGKEIANRLGISESTFTRHYVPALKNHGILNRRGLGYYHPDLYHPDST